MNEREPDFSRVGRKKERNKSNKILNLLIGAVVLAIVVVAITLFTGSKTDNKAVEGENSSIEKNDPALKDNENLESSESSSEELSVTENESETNPSDSSNSNANTSESQKEDEVIEDEQRSEAVTILPSEDSTVSQSIIDDSWKPVGTSQTGEHVSLYDGESVDWNEKKQALAYATGLPAESMIFWKIKNGGGPQKAIGIVSSRDSKEKYRVYLEWVNGEGWKPVKKDVLTTLEVND